MRVCRSVLVLLPVLILPLACADNIQRVPVAPQNGDPIKVLRESSHAAYLGAIEQHRKEMLSSGPVIVQRLLDMKLHRSNGEVIRFEMKKRQYFLMAAASHPPLGIYSLIRMNEGFGALNQETVKRLLEYRMNLQEAVDHVPSLKIDDVVTARMIDGFDTAIELVDSAIAKRRLTRDEFADYTSAVRGLIEQNLALGAREQLEQYRAQLERWRSEYPDENWPQLRVVVLGFHQPRELYVLRLFFDWLLQEPGYEHRVVFAEFQQPIFGRNAIEVEDRALELLTKVDMEQPLGDLVFGDPSAMGRDVMGPSAKRLLIEWGDSTWP